MKAIATSDLHGELPAITEEFDLLLIAGDICPVTDHRRERQFEWLCTEFVDWVNGLPFKNVFSRVVFCAGNHDFILESISKKKLNEIISKVNDGRLVYLDNEEYDFEVLEDDGTLNTYKIFGCPYCKVFGRWAFMRENLDKYYGAIPSGLDILITHDAPGVDVYGMITQGRYKGTDAGNKSLAQYIHDVKPICAFHGHIHSSPHEIRLIHGTFYGNVSLMDENYEPVFKPLFFSLTKRWDSENQRMVIGFSILNGYEKTSE